MAARDPMKLRKMLARLPTLNAWMKESKKRPFTGVTQGGSSRDNAPAKVAATDGRWRPPKTKWD